MTVAAAGPKHETNAHAKALALNLDPDVYGTFAEIGGGQEVAHWFLRVGAASGTVARTICAYDKAFSDATYGSGTRYVSRERLIAMLDHEFALLTDRLGAARGDHTRFFVFADTAATRNFKGDNEQHGWIGVRFQDAPQQETSEILLHVELRDPAARLQQETLGLLGVNLIYAAFHQSGSVETFLDGLSNELSVHRLEIDIIKLRGPKFAGQDERLWSLAALRRGMAHAVAFDSSAQVAEASGLLRKRPLLVERGRFDSVQPFQGQMLHAAAEEFKREDIANTHAPVEMLEISLKPVTGPECADDAEILERVERIASLGPVLVSDYPQGHQLVSYLQRYTVEPVRFVFGIATIAQILHEAHHGRLPGSLLEQLGRLLAENVRIYAYPMTADVFRQILGEAMAGDEPLEDVVTADNWRPPHPLDHLYNYLRDAGWIVALPA